MKEILKVEFKFKFHSQKIDNVVGERNLNTLLFSVIYLQMKSMQQENSISTVIFAIYLCPIFEMSNLRRRWSYFKRIYTFITSYLL